MGIASDLSDIKDVSDTIVANKVSKFCYTDTAYDDNNANGVSVYNVNNEQNIPTADPSIMKVNETVVTKGWRTRASSITRMFMNHMLGRLSYNVNKLSDMFSSLLTAIDASLDTANGLATVNSSGKVTLLNNVVNTGDSDTPAENGTDKFTTGGAFTELAKKAPVDHSSTTEEYGRATNTRYGHVKFTDEIRVFTPDGGGAIQTFTLPALYVRFFTSSGSAGFSSFSGFTIYAMILTNGVTTSFVTVTATGDPMTGYSASINVPANSLIIASSAGGAGMLVR